MSPAAAPAATPTRSEIESWTTTHLAAAAANWRASATSSEDAFDQHRQNVSSPGGTVWKGDAKDAALDRVTADISIVGSQSDMLREAASVAENGVTDINAAKREALSTISAAENDDFTVGEGLSVTDNRAYDEETAAARQTAAAEHAEDIRWTAERLAQADAHVGSRLEAKAAELEEIQFDNEERSGHPTIRLVDHQTDTTSADDKQPAKSWEDMLLPPKSGGEPNAAEKPEAAAAADGTAKSPLDEMLLPDRTADPDQPGSLNEALDEVAGEHVPKPPTLTEQLLSPPTGTGKPGDPRYTKSPLESPIVDADPTVIAQQQAKVAAAEQNLATAETAADTAARQDYIDGAGPGPRTGEAFPLAQDVFDARAELTKQRDILVGLNEAATETGLPAAEVNDLPINADVQAFPAEPSVVERATEALADGTKDTAKTVWDTAMPDVANMYDVATDYDNATPEQKQHAALDAAGLVPLPGMKWLSEGVEHSLDALGVAGRHSDDIPTGAVDDVADTVDARAHHTPDAPSVPHTDAVDSQFAPMQHEVGDSGGDMTSGTAAPLPDIDQLYKTEPDTGYFWSGRTSEGVGVGPQGDDLGLAAQIADENGGVTLELFQARNGIEMPDWGDGSDPAVVKAWQDHSLAWASSMQGEVRALLGDNLRPGNIWETVELPRLMENPNVTRIVKINPQTGAQTVIFEP